MQIQQLEQAAGTVPNQMKEKEQPVYEDSSVQEHIAIAELDA